VVGLLLLPLLLLLLLLQGVKVFLVAPPTPHNLAAFDSCCVLHVVQSLLLLLVLLQGVKVFLVAPPTPHNLAAFESWAGDSSQSRKWLGGSLQGCAKVLLAAGSTMLLPPGKRLDTTVTRDGCSASMCNMCQGQPCCFSIMRHSLCQSSQRFVHLGVVAACEVGR
jgi:hypothetical protein